MELLNATRMRAGHTQGLTPEGRELLVVAVKGTFGIPDHGEPVRLADTQAPLVEADTFTGEPGLSAPVLESDYAPFKHRCDVVVTGSAHAPGGRPATRVTVGVKVARMQKAFEVVGDRFWQASAAGIAAGPPRPFVTRPICYDCAFGGSDDFHPDPQKHSAYMANPIGCGYHAILSAELVDGTPMPNTEDRGAGVTMPHLTYRPMAFGPLGRGWEPRRRLAGTYDQNWLDNVFPFLPTDFDDRYYQCAPIDQQTDFLRGDEEVLLLNLTPDGRRAFRVPRIDVPIVFFYKRGGRHETVGAADTLHVDAHAGTFSITWRAHLPIRRNMFEVAQVLAGEMPRGWWHARKVGKTYHRSLAEASRAKRGALEGVEE